MFCFVRSTQGARKFPCLRRYPKAHRVGAGKSHREDKLHVHQTHFSSVLFVRPQRECWDHRSFQAFYSFLFPCPSRPPTFSFFLCSMSIRGLFCALPRGYPRMGMSSEHQSQCWLGQSRVRAMTVWVPKPLKPSPIWGRGSCYGNLPLPKFHSVKLSLRLLLAINHAPSETQHQIVFATPHISKPILNFSNSLSFFFLCMWFLWGFLHFFLYLSLWHS